MQKRSRDGNENTVFIGKKDMKSYVMAVLTQFNSGEGTVIIKARGRAISRAVDVAEYVRHRFLKDVQVKDIQISTEEVEGDRGMVKVSAMEISLGK
ncbi:MAG: DNA-binding protein Alba [Candidatus Altiarchaeota archaeon]